jgi:type I restriction enzyme S subunit
MKPKNSLKRNKMMEKAVQNKLQRYDSYKDSGVEWLGEVPEHWDLTRLGTRFKERKTKVSDKDFPPLSVTKNGTVPQLANAAKSNDGDNRKLVKKGDFAINSRSDRKGSSGIAYQDGSVSLIYIVMEPLDIHPIYCNYLLKSYNFIEEFYRMGHGIVADLWTTRYDEMKVIMVGIPPLSEQTKIAQFLDDKTAKIEDAIAIKKQQINLLKERKQLLIHKAVTQGLNPNVKLKDSGVEWIGEIPEHWVVKPLKYIGNSIIGLTYNPNNLCEEEEGVLVFRSSNLLEGKIKYGEKENVYVKSRISNKLMVRENDILICSRNGSRDLIGKCALISKEDIGASFGAFTTVFRSEINPYIFCILNSSIFKALSGSFLTSTINQLTIGNLNSIQVPVPPKEERKELKTHINNFSNKIETAISLKQQEIAKLKEYKSSLINSVVTGKVKVC